MEKKLPEEQRKDCSWTNVHATSGDGSENSFNLKSQHWTLNALKNPASYNYWKTNTLKIKEIELLKCK